MGRLAADAPKEMIHLRAGRAQVEIAPRAGGAIAAFRWDVSGAHVNWLRPATAEAIRDRDPEGMACFPVVPYSNRIRDGRFSFEGRKIQLPAQSGIDAHCEHGHGWRSAWSVVAHDGSTARLLHRYPAGQSWPWPYVAEQLFVLTDENLAVTVTLTNIGDRPMPCGLGLHPYFPATKLTRLSARVTLMWETDAEVLPTRLVVPAQAENPTSGVVISNATLDNAFTGWTGEAEISWPETGARLSMTADAPLRVLVVYTPAGADYFCAEPVSNITDAANLAATRTDTGLLTLQPGHSVCATVRFIPSNCQDNRVTRTTQGE